MATLRRGRRFDGTLGRRGSASALKRAAEKKTEGNKNQPRKERSFECCAIEEIKGGKQQNTETSYIIKWKESIFCYYWYLYIYFSVLISTLSVIYDSKSVSCVVKEEKLVTTFRTADKGKSSAGEKGNSARIFFTVWNYFLLIHFHFTSLLCVSICAPTVMPPCFFY